MIQFPFAVSTFYLTSLVGVSNVAGLCDDCNATMLIGNETLLEAAFAGSSNNASSSLSLLLLGDDCICPPPETALSTKIVYALWVWCIFLTFPGTFAMQPAVTTQTFGHK